MGQECFAVPPLCMMNVFLVLRFDESGWGAAAILRYEISLVNA